MIGLVALTSSAQADAREPLDPYPRLVIAGGPLIGPTIASEEDCRANGPTYYCENNGYFLGLGANLEARVRLRKLLYVHLRGLIVGNTARTEGAYSGAGGTGIGIGVYHRYLFARGEYLLLGAFGSNLYRAPFQDERMSTVVMGNHAGLLSTGLRTHLTGRLGIELWGGLMIGPRILRTTMREELNEDRVQVSFLAGFNLTFDALINRAPASAPPAAP